MTIEQINILFQESRKETKKLFSVFMTNKTLENYENYKMAKSRKIELCAMIESF